MVGAIPVGLIPYSLRSLEGKMEKTRTVFEGFQVGGVGVFDAADPAILRA